MVVEQRETVAALDWNCAFPYDLPIERYDGALGCAPSRESST